MLRQEQLGSYRYSMGPSATGVRRVAGHLTWGLLSGSPRACDNGDSECLTRIGYPGFKFFGTHPGQSSPRTMLGNWVAPSSGTFLVRLLVNCDIPWYTDLQVPGSGRLAKVCASTVRLTATADAYFNEQVQEEATAAEAAADLGVTFVAQPETGQAMQVVTVNLDRSVIELNLVASCRSSPVHQALIDDMLIPGSEGSAILASMFTAQQQPHFVVPIVLEPVSQTTATGGGHRRAQTGARVSGLSVTLQAAAPTERDALLALESLQFTGSGRRHLLEDTPNSCGKYEAVILAKERQLADQAVQIEALQRQAGETGSALARTPTVTVNCEDPTLFSLTQHCNTP